MKKFITPKKVSKTELNKFFKKKKLQFLLEESKNNFYQTNKLKKKTAYKPELNDLYRLYKFIVLNKRTTVLEFGSGWSSLIITLALNELKEKYTHKIKNLRRNNPFELFVIENEKKYLNITKKKIENFNKEKLNNCKINFNFSDVNMVKFNNHIATEFKRLPMCNPDFIYLDGPDQFKVKKDINGISTKHDDLMPMSCDILKIEYFLIPGTIILVDGRGANVKFLRDNFKRNWVYRYDKSFDQHIFYLNDPSIGKYNDRMLKFYIS